MRNAVASSLRYLMLVVDGRKFYSKNFFKPQDNIFPKIIENMFFLLKTSFLGKFK